MIAHDLVKLIAISPLLCAIAIAAPRQGASVFRPSGSGTLATMGATDSVQIGGGYTVVSDLAGLPAPVAGVITLLQGAYKQGAPLSLGSAVIRTAAGAAVEWNGSGYQITGSGTSIFDVKGPFNLSNATIISTSTGDGITMNSAAAQSTIRDSAVISIGGTAINAPLGQSIVFVSGAVTNSQRGLRIGSLQFGAYISSVGIIENATGIEFDGTTPLMTMTALNCISSVSSSIMLKISNSASFPGVWNLLNSYLNAASAQIGISVSSASSFDTQGMHLSSNTFAGAGTYMSGISANTTQARFLSNVGIENSAAYGNAYISSGTTTTTLPTAPGYTELLATAPNAVFVATNAQLFSIIGGNKWRYDGGVAANINVMAQVSLSTSVTSGDYLARIEADTTGTGSSYAAIGPPTNMRATSSSIDTFAVRGSVSSAPQNTLFRITVAKANGTAGTVTLLNGAFEVVKR